MNAPILLANFTHIYDYQSFAKECRVTIECSHIGGTDCLCDAEAERALRALIEPFPVRGVHFNDSGNFHYMTKLWTDKLREPFSLLLFDRHPDMQRGVFWGLLSCGSWVRAMMDENLFLREVCIVGASEELVREVDEEYADRAIFCPGNATNKAWREFVEGATLPVYVSVDKDVLDPADATTNWDQGDMRLDELARMVEQLSTRCRVLGADICGECHLDEMLSDEACTVRNDRANSTLASLFLRTICPE